MNKFCKKLQEILPQSLPFVYADIGAMGGIPLKWEKFREYLSIVAFEPDEREYVKLKQQQGFTVFNKAVYRDSSSLEFYITREAGKSSLLPPNIPLLKDFNNVKRFDVIRRVPVPLEDVVSLDGLASKEKDFPTIDFLKIDTQGSELFILEGAKTKVLPHVIGAQVEVETIPMYEGQPLLEDVLVFMRKAGFDLYDLRRTFWKRAAFSEYIGRGQFIFGDALFLRRVDVLVDALKKDAGGSKALLGKIITLSFVYHTFDYAYAVLEEFKGLSLLTSEEYQRLSVLIREAAKKGSCPEFPGKEVIFKVFRSMAEKLTPRSHLGWSDADRWIGNVRDL